MRVIPCPTIATEIALGAGLPMGRAVSPSRKLDYLFNRLLRMSRHRRLAADARPRYTCFPCWSRATRRCCDIERTKGCDSGFGWRDRCRTLWAAIRQDREPGCCSRKKVCTMSAPCGVSIIVVNYNNAEFLGRRSIAPWVRPIHIAK